LMILDKKSKPFLEKPLNIYKALKIDKKEVISAKSTNIEIVI